MTQNIPWTIDTVRILQPEIQMPHLQNTKRKIYEFKKLAILNVCDSNNSVVRRSTQKQPLTYQFRKNHSLYTNVDRNSEYFC